SPKDVLVGLTSYGNGCAQRLQPGVYTRVSSVRACVQGEILREEALRKAVVGSVLHELASSHCYPGVPQQASVSFDNDNSVTVRRRFFLPSPDARFARVTSQSTGQALGQCVALGVSVDAQATGKTEADAFVLESTLPSGETFRASAKEAFEAWGNCMTTLPPSASASSGSAVAPVPQFRYFDIDPFWNSNGAMFGGDWYSATSEDLSKASWEEKGRCEKDGLLVKFETAGTSEKWGRLLLENASTNELSKTFVFAKSEGGRGAGTAGVRATAARLGSTGAILDLASQVDEQIFGVELSCNQTFDVVLDGKPQAPRKDGDDFVHVFADPAKRTSHLPGRGRTRSY
ncbi:MAG: hypothetical protein IOD12_07865, partial [Silvanigrellales bacterium]|nr:hypothetical protein [Silvanigrellales bacterium]